MTAKIEGRSLELSNCKCWVECEQKIPIPKYALVFEAEPYFREVRLAFTYKEHTISMLEDFISMIKEADQ